MVRPQEGMAAPTIIIMYTVASSPVCRLVPVSNLASGLMSKVTRKNKNRAAPVE